MCNNMKNGFTLIELMISVFILSVAIVGMYSAFSAVTILTSTSADRLTATYLAQEGMEIFRNIRDTNWLKMDAGVPGAAWLSELDYCVNGCEADYKSTSMAQIMGDYLYLDGNGFYVYNPTNLSPTKTKFQRKITITCFPDTGDCSSAYSVLVKIQVSWTAKGNILYPTSLADTCGPYNCITIEGTLYDWYNYVSPTNP